LDSTSGCFSLMKKRKFFHFSQIFARTLATAPLVVRGKWTEMIGRWRAFSKIVGLVKIFDFSDEYARTPRKIRIKGAGASKRIFTIFFRVFDPREYY